MVLTKYPHYAPSEKSLEELQAETQRLHALIDAKNKDEMISAEEQSKLPFSLEQARAQVEAMNKRMAPETGRGRMHTPKK
jgi:hypothetical protein